MPLGMEVGLGPGMNSQMVTRLGINRARRNGSFLFMAYSFFPLVVFMAALCNRAGHYILPCGLFLLLFFLSSPNLSRRRLDVYHTSTYGVALLRI